MTLSLTRKQVSNEGRKTGRQAERRGVKEGRAKGGREARVGGVGERDGRGRREEGRRQGWEGG